MKHILTRRAMVKGLAAAGVAASVARTAGAAGEAPKAGKRSRALPTWKNEDFYKDGKLDANAAKEAYFELMRFHRFPVYPVLKTDQFWAIDFGLGKFAEVGMGGIFWINDKRDDYLLHEIWLLPGQMIPEHWHVKIEGVAPKMEAWLVRNGMALMYSEGEATEGVAARIPPSHRDIAVARHEVKVNPGEVVKLEVAEKRHWMIGGPEGAIVTEVATFHDNAALRFTHPNVKM